MVVSCTDEVKEHKKRPQPIQEVPFHHSCLQTKETEKFCPPMSTEERQYSPVPSSNWGNTFVKYTE